MIEEYYFGKDEKLYAALIDLEKAYDMETLDCFENLWYWRTIVSRNKGIL